MPYQGKKNYKNQQTALEIIVVGFLKALWWIATLPFKKKGKTAGFSQEQRNEIVVKRQEIENLSKSENVYELKHAVMESDKLVDKILKLKGYQGDTFADRLRSAEKDISPTLYDQIWQGHKVRNQLAHESELQLTNLELAEASKKLLNYIKNV